MSCLGCEKRHINCHADCEDYKKWKAELDEKSAKIKKEKARHKASTEVEVQGAINRKKTRARRPLKSRINQ